MFNLEDCRVESNIIMDEYKTGIIPGSSKKGFMEDQMRHRIAKYLVDRHAREIPRDDFPGTVQLKMELMVFSMDEFSEFMHQMADRFRQPAPEPPKETK